MNRRLVVLTVAALTVAVVGLTIALLVVVSDSGSDSTTTDFVRMRGVINKTQEQAEAILGDAGFEVAAKVVPNPNPGVGPGETPPEYVQDQDPPAGSLVEAGSTVTLTVSGSE